jgi:hypothetical protein
MKGLGSFTENTSPLSRGERGPDGEVKYTIKSINNVISQSHIRKKDITAAIFARKMGLMIEYYGRRNEFAAK